MAGLETFFDTATERIAFLYHLSALVLFYVPLEPSLTIGPQRRRLRDEEHYSMPLLCF